MEDCLYCPTPFLDFRIFPVLRMHPNWCHGKRQGYSRILGDSTYKTHTFISQGCLPFLLWFRNCFTSALLNPLRPTACVVTEGNGDGGGGVVDAARLLYPPNFAFAVPLPGTSIGIAKFWRYAGLKEIKKTYCCPSSCAAVASKSLVSPKTFYCDFLILRIKNKHG